MINYTIVIVVRDEKMKKATYMYMLCYILSGVILSFLFNNLIQVLFFALTIISLLMASILVFEEILEKKGVKK